MPTTEPAQREAGHVDADTAPGPTGPTGRFRARALALVLGLGVAAGLTWTAFLTSPQLREGVRRLRITADPIGIWQLDPVLGYSHVPGAIGRHTHVDSFDVTYTIDADGHRVTPTPRQPRGRIAVLGGSFTFGFGVEDEQAWPSVLAAAMPTFKIDNRAAIAWGTTHALLSLQQAMSEDPPDAVLYGWIPHHANRNYRRDRWVQEILGFGRHHPYFELEGDQLVPKLLTKPEEMLAWDTPGLVRTERALSLAMVARMRTLCRQANVPFVLVRLTWGDDAWLLADTTFEAWNLGEMKRENLAFDGHPNARWHADIGAEVAARLQQRLETSPGHL